MDYVWFLPKNSHRHGKCARDMSLQIPCYWGIAVFENSGIGGASFLFLFSICLYLCINFCCIWALRLTSLVLCIYLIVLKTFFIHYSSPCIWPRSAREVSYIMYKVSEVHFCKIRRKSYDRKRLLQHGSGAYCLWSIYGVRGTRMQPLIFVGCSVHYWVSCAINKRGFLRLHLPRF